MNRNHPVTPEILRTADTMREALHVAPTCCANHACEIALVTAISFAADVAKDDPVEMRRLVDALTNHVFAAIKGGTIKFARDRR